MPANEVLELAYRRAVAVSRVNQQLVDIIQQARAEAAYAKVPKALGKKVRAVMEKSGLPWDLALHQLIKDGK